MKSEDEIGALSDGFNRMLANIEARDAELDQYHKQIVKLVEERTNQTPAGSQGAFEGGGGILWI